MAKKGRIHSLLSVAAPEDLIAVWRFYFLHDVSFLVQHQLKSFLCLFLSLL